GLSTVSRRGVSGLSVMPILCRPRFAHADLESSTGECNKIKDFAWHWSARRLIGVALLSIVKPGHDGGGGCVHLNTSRPRRHRGRWSRGLRFGSARSEEQMGRGEMAGAQGRAGLGAEAEAPP